MHDFKYCVWLTTDDPDCPWRRFSEGFQPHMTIRSHISTLEEATRLQQRVDNYLQASGPLELILHGDVVCSCDEDFHGVYYNVRLGEAGAQFREPPWWWPEDAHVSFLYSYDLVNKETVDRVVDLVDVTCARFDRAVVRKCTGHYSRWGDDS